MTTIPTPDIRRVIVQHNDGEWMLMSDDGMVTVHLTADDVIRKIRRQDAKRSGFAVTVVEWTNVPVGFVPPGEQS